MGSFRDLVLKHLSRDRANAAAPIVGQAPSEDELAPGLYWHSTDAHPTNLLFNNVWAGRGRLGSMSAIRQKHGNRLITLGDLYPLVGPAAEAVWETVRKERYPEKPSRSGALFLFDDARGETVASGWRPGSERVMLKVRILRSARMHRGDLSWFNGVEGERARAADRYWAGQPNPDATPIWEHVVDGEVYFPDWSSPPFGPLQGNHVNPVSCEVVTCPVCGIEFDIVPPNATMFTSAERSRCVEDPDLPILHDCVNVAPLVEVAWTRSARRD